MTASSAHAAADGIQERWFYACLVIVVMGAAVLLTRLSFEYVIFLCGSVACLTMGAIGLRKPPKMLYFVLVVSPISGLVQSLGTIQVGATDVSLSGVAWILIAIELVVIMWAKFRDVVFAKEFYPLLGFAGWVTMRWFWDPTSVGLKDVLFYTFPLLVGTYAISIFCGVDPRRSHRIEKILLWSPWIPLGYFAVSIPMGIVKFDSGAPRGPIDPRALASYLLVIAAFGFAKWRYDLTSEGARRGRNAGVLATLIIIFTLSRTATVIALVLLSISRMNRLKPRNAILNLVLSGVLAGLVFATVPALGSRLFTSGSIDLSDGISADDINTEGRAAFWATTFIHALDHPVVGWGLASARLIVRDTFPGGEWDEYHPHNEFLQVFHDLGLIGLALMIGGWLYPLYRCWKDWRTCEASRDWGRAKWTIASLLALTAILLSALTGNELHYAFVTGPAFVIAGIAFGQARTKEKEFCAPGARAVGSS